jgi:hypothetical protein
MSKKGRLKHWRRAHQRDGKLIKAAQVANPVSHWRKAHIRLVNGVLIQVKPCFVS